jgi:hypothetical protein
MKTSGLAFFFALWCIVLAAPCAYAAETNPLDWRGAFEVGFRAVDVTGNEDKYKEDVNYSKGPRLFKLDLDITPSEGTERAFDLLNLSISNMGGDPYEHFGIALKKYRRYNFSYTRNRLTYFYKDIIKPPAEADSRAVEGGDFHTFDFTHSFHRMDFNFRPTKKSQLFFNFDRQYKTGGTTTTRDINRGEFELEKPLEKPRDDIKDDYVVGAQMWFDKVSLYVDETYRDYRNNQSIVLQGFAAEGNTELSTFEQRTPVDYKMPQTTVRTNIRPNKRTTINAGYVYTNLDADLDYHEIIIGTDYQGNPVADTTRGSGDFERKIHMVDADAAYDLNDWATLIGSVSYKKFDQEGKLTIEDEMTAVDGDFNSVDFDIGGRVPIGEMVTASAGVSYERREVNGFHEEEAEEEGEEEEHPNTTRTTAFVSAEAQPDPRVNIFGEFERGFYDNPFTLISPSDQTRYKVRLRARPTPETNVVATFLRREITNDQSDADLTNNNFSVRCSYKKSPVKVYGAYTRMDIDNKVDHYIETFSGIWESIYEGNTNQFMGGVLLRAYEDLSLGFQTIVYKNTGSFELDKQEYSAYAMLKCPSGYTLRFGYDREDYNEKASDWDDYAANIFTLAVGYGFGR